MIDLPWILNGKQYRQSLKTTSKKQATLKAIRLDAEILEGRYKPKHKAPSIVEIIDAYNSHLKTEGRALGTRSKVSLVARRVLSLAERLGAKSIAEVDLRFVDAYRRERVEAGAEPKTVLNETVIIRQLVNFPLKRRMIHEDPLHGIELRKVKSKRQPFLATRGCR